MSRRHFWGRMPPDYGVYCRWMDHLAKLLCGRALCLLALLGVCAGCAPPSPRDTRAADVRIITEGEVSWVRHWSTSDAERIVARYAEDATVMSPNVAPAIGSEAIREMIKQLVRDGNFALTFDVPCVEVARSGDLGFDQEASYRPGYLSQGLSQATGWCVESARS